MAPPNSDELISQFIALTQASSSVATNRLGVANWDLEAAVQEFFTSKEEEEADEAEAADPNSTSRAGRTLGGEGVPSRRVPAPAPATGPSSSSSQQRKKFGSLRDLASGNAPPPSGSDDDDDDADPDLYAGGEKSGLAVQNPDDLRRKIIEKARRQAAEGGLPGDEAGSSGRRSHFTGRAQTLGGDDTPSQVIDDPSASAQRPAVRVQRTLHFWENGFSVDDGPLYDTANPENAAMLRMIQGGRAPYEILNVQHNQEVDVKIEEHEGPFVQPKRQYKPFGGKGQRLGSPTPAASGVTPPPPAPAAAATTTAPVAARAPTFDVDSSQPTVRIQIRLADGTRLVSSFNTTHTIGDIYGFVTAANAASQSRQWVLASTFPNKDLTEKGLAIGESPELKKGGAIVQKWT